MKDHVEDRLVGVGKEERQGEKVNVHDLCDATFVVIVFEVSVLDNGGFISENRCLCYGWTRMLG